MDGESAAVFFWYACEGVAVSWFLQGVVDVLCEDVEGTFVEYCADRV